MFVHVCLAMFSFLIVVFVNSKCCFVDVCFIHEIFFCSLANVNLVKVLLFGSHPLYYIELV